MIDSIINFLKKIKEWQKKDTKSKETAKERLHLVLMQDRANVSADFLEMMKQEIIDVIKKYIDVDESEIDVRLTNKENSDGTVGTPALYANIPISNVRDIKGEDTDVNDLKNSVDEKSNNKKKNCKNNEKNDDSNRGIDTEKKDDSEIDEIEEENNKDNNDNINETDVKVMKENENIDKELEEKSEKTEKDYKRKNKKEDNKTKETI